MRVCYLRFERFFLLVPPEAAGVVFGAVDGPGLLPCIGAEVGGQKGTLPDPGRGMRKKMGHLVPKMVQNWLGTLCLKIGVFWPQTSNGIFGGPLNT